MKKRVTKKIVSLALMVTLVASFSSAIMAATWDYEDAWEKEDAVKLSNSQGKAHLYTYIDRGLQARINVVNSNNYKTKEGKKKYLWAAVVATYASAKYNTVSDVKSSGELLASKYDNKALVSYIMPAKYYNDNGSYKAKTYTSNDVRYKPSSSTYSILGSTLIYYKK